MKKILLTVTILFSINLFANPGFVPTRRCAILWGHADFDQTKRPGGVVMIEDEQKTSRLRGGPTNDFDDFNNQVSALSVKRGCRLYAYDHSNFTKLLQIFEGNKVYSYTSPNPDYKLKHNDRISSVFCTCVPDFDDDDDELTEEERIERMKEIARRIAEGLKPKTANSNDRDGDGATDQDIIDEIGRGSMKKVNVITNPDY